MHSHVARALAALSLPLLVAAQSASAQVVAAPTSAPSTHCSRVTTLAGGAIGGALGGWLGFVAAKIRYSDWNDASRGAAAHRSQNVATISGAVIGSVVTGFLTRAKSCGSARAFAQRTSQARRPISVEEITRSGITGNVYDLVYTLRRNWLNLRGVEALTEGSIRFNVDGQEVMFQGEPRLVVYVDNAKLGNVEEMRNLPIVNISEIRYYDGAEATYKWGAGLMHGVIQIITVPERAPE
jgi:hypothetical protein